MVYHKSENYQLISQGEDVFSILDQSLFFDYNSFTYPFEDFQTQTWFSSQDKSFAYPISTSNYVVDDYRFMASLGLENFSTLSQDILSESWNEITSYYNDQVQPNRDEMSRRTSTICNPNMEIIMHEDNSFINPFDDFQTQTWFSSQESFAYYPISTSYMADDYRLLSPLDLESVSTLTQDVLSGSWNEITSNFNDQVHPHKDEFSRTTSIGNPSMEIVLHEGYNNTMKEKDTTSKKRRYKEDLGGVTKNLTKETIKQYFNMTITKASKKLDIGLTLMKKRCRELGVNRWPHRKLMSLQTLIEHLEDSEMMEEDVHKRKKIRDDLEFLKMEKKRIEENPDLEFRIKTKRLRQAYFKDTFNRRRVLSLTSF